MSDVATEAHVSVKTVSRVVNDIPGVRQDTATRVRAAVERLGFRHGDTDGMVPKGRTRTIGFVVEDLANPFYSQIGAAVEREARIRQHQLITASAEGSPTRERVVLQALVARRVDGIVIVPAGGSSPVDPLVRASGTPVVYVDRPVGGDACDTVLSDNRGGLRSAVEHLVAHGHRRIGFLGDDAGFWTARRRRESFLATHQSLGLPGAPLVAMGPHTTETAHDMLARWVRGSEGVTAVIAGNNRVTLAVLLALKALGERGAHTAIVGYDDFEFAELLDPPVTVVHQDPAAMGHAAAQLLFSRLLGETSPPQTVVIPTVLIVRSSGPLRPLNAVPARPRLRSPALAQGAAQGIGR